MLSPLHFIELNGFCELMIEVKREGEGEREREEIGENKSECV